MDRWSPYDYKVFPIIESTPDGQRKLYLSAGVQNDRRMGLKALEIHVADAIRTVDLRREDVMAVAVQGRADGFGIGAARPLFAANFPSPSLGVPFDVTRDGRKFIVYSGQETPSTPMTLVLHWNAKLKK